MPVRGEPPVGQEPRPEIVARAEGAPERDADPPESGKAASPSATAAYFAAATRPAVTSVSAAWIPNTLSASSSLAMAMSQCRTSLRHHLPGVLPHFQSLAR